MFHRCYCLNTTKTLGKTKNVYKLGGARWLSGMASDFGARCRGFKTSLRRVVSLIKTLYSPLVHVIPRKRRLRPDMTEKLLTGMLNLNTNKTKLINSLNFVRACAFINMFDSGRGQVLIIQHVLCAVSGNERVHVFPDSIDLLYRLKHDFYSAWSRNLYMHYNNNYIRILSGLLDWI